MEIRLLTQASCPIVLIGDVQQSIADFRHQVPDTYCDQKNKCRFPQETAVPDQFPTVEWYSTYRLCPLTIQMIEDMTGARMVSMRKDAGTILWKSTISAPTSLILCRTNENVVRMLLQYQMQGLRVIAGARIAAQLKTASLSGSSKGMGGLGKKLLKDGQLASVVKMLIAREIDLKDLAASNVLAACCIFQAKGYETDHVAVHRDILDHARDEKLQKSASQTEQNVLLVALSRHKLSLTVLIDIPPAVVHVEPAKVQSVLDLSAFAYTKP